VKRNGRGQVKLWTAQGQEHDVALGSAGVLLDNGLRLAVRDTRRRSTRRVTSSRKPAPSAGSRPAPSTGRPAPPPAPLPGSPPGPPLANGGSPPPVIPGPPAPQVPVPPVPPAPPDQPGGWDDPWLRS
jgi:hypothetical protein